MSDENVTDVTAALPTMDHDTRSKVQKVGVFAATAAGLLLLADEGVKRFRRSKKVEVVVTDVPPTTENPS